MPRKSARKNATPPAEEAQFVFRGTILEKGASTMAEVPAGANTVVVRVDEIIHGPPVLEGCVDSSITVQLGPKDSVTTGTEYVFHTNGWIFGESLAVTSVGVEPAGAVGAVRAAVGERPAAKVKARADRADLVVSGEVTLVREVPPEPGAPITEHDPDWHEAVVRVDAVERGKTKRGGTPKQVTIRFANARDVRWAEAPKFSVGTEGVWMLGDRSPAAKAMRSAVSMPSDHYLVVSPEDFYPKDSAARVLSVIK